MEVYPQLVISSSNFVLAATANKVFLQTSYNNIYWASTIFGDRAVSATMSLPGCSVFFSSIRSIWGACNRAASSMLPQPIMESLGMKSRDLLCSQAVQMIWCTREPESPNKDSVRDRAGWGALWCPLQRDCLSGQPGKGAGKGVVASELGLQGWLLTHLEEMGGRAFQAKGKLLVELQRREWTQHVEETGGQPWGAICNFIISFSLLKENAVMPIDSGNMQ